MIANPYFNHVSVIFSWGDVIQCLDPQNLYGLKWDEKVWLFSRKFFHMDSFGPDVKKRINQYAVQVNNKI